MLVWQGMYSNVIPSEFKQYHTGDD